MPRMMTGVSLALAVALHALAEPVKEVEITPDPVQDGQQTFDVCFTPGETRTYDKLTFDCVLHQEFPKATTDQRTGIQVNEPAAFTYRRREVKMVEDLDLHVSFRVPVGVERLRDIYGPTAFNTNYPVSVARMKITALIKETPVWSFEVAARGRHAPKAVAASGKGDVP